MPDHICSAMHRVDWDAQERSRVLAYGIEMNFIPWPLPPYLTQSTFIVDCPPSQAPLEGKIPDPLLTLLLSCSEVSPSIGSSS